MHASSPTQPFKRRGVQLAIASVLLSQAWTLQAQAADTDSEAQAASKTTEATPPALGKVTVTATRREASLQSVPIAVSVLDGRKLEQSNLNSIQTIANEVPSLTFRQQGGNKDSSILIRGVGTISTSPGIEPTVSTVIDGVVYARPGQATLDLLDVERIEVLRGPQGTLFGKNASAGVINVVTREPSADPHAYVDTSYFEGGEKRVRLGVSGTLVPDLLYASINGLYADYDGNVKNTAGGHLNGYERQGARAKFLLTPTQDLDITLIADYTHGTNSVPGANGVPYSSRNAGFNQAISPIVPSKGNRKVNTDGKSEVTDTNQGVSAQIDWRIQDYTLTSITAFRTWDNTQNTSTSPIGNNYDASRINTTFAATRDRGTVDSKQFSQELRIASPKERFLEYVAGAYYLKSKTDETYQRSGTNASNLNFTGQADYGVESDSVALFGESTLNFTQAFRGIVGLRWTHDDLSFDHVRNTPVPGDGVRASQGYRKGDTTESAYSGRLGVQYDLNEDVISYFTYSRGYKGPAYNVFFNMLDVNNDAQALKPETSSSFELGLKSSLLNNRVFLNLAAFYTEYHNYQANVPDIVGTSTVTRLINAGDVSTRGVEVDVSAKASSRLSLSGSLAYVDAQVDQINCPSNSAVNCQVNGKTLPFSPKFKSVVRANYAIPLNAGYVVDIGTDYIWQSKQQYSLLDQYEGTEQEAYGIWNASVALSTDTGWRVALIGRNLLDRSYASNLVNNAGSTYVNRYVPRDDARYFGINVRKDF